MDNELTYTLSLQDLISAKLQKIGITSDSALDKFAKLQKQALNSSKLMKEMGGSVGALREKLALLKNEKEWIPASNIASIRKYNSEIKNLEKQIIRLDTINGSVFKSNLKSAISNLPMADLITNPVAQAGAAIFSAGKMAMTFDEAMAKINTTAQLTPSQLKGLKSELIDIGVDAGADLSKIPEAFEKILSQTNDLTLSSDILSQSLKGSKAGFTDQTIVADALAQTLSLVGKENTNAAEVLDTLFAAKRVGAGEFKDFSNYIPGLIAGGQALGLGFKETAGLFAFMTGKGQSAERSAMLMQNAYTALGKSNITAGLENEGVSVFNIDGSMKAVDIIFGQLQKKLEGFGNDDKAKSGFLEKIGLVDAQAKQAFMVLASDGEKLTQTLNDVANAQGEADKAFKNSENPLQKISLLWSKIQSLGISFGGIISTILVPALSGIIIVTTPIIDLLTWFFDLIADGNPFMLGFIATIGLLSVAYNWNTIALSAQTLWLKKDLIFKKMSAFWAGIITAKTKLWAASTWLLNSALMTNPVVWVVAGIIALVAVVTLAWKKLGWFRGAVMAAWEAIKGFGIILKDFVIDRIKGILNGLGGMAKALLQFFTGDWSNAWETAKTAAGDLIGIDAAKNAIATAKKVGSQMGAAYYKGVEQVKSGNNIAGINNQEIIPGINQTVIPGTNFSPVAPVPASGNQSTIKTQSDAIASSSNKTTSLSINIGNMIESVNFNGQFKENATEMRKLIEQELIRALNMAYATA